jgi:four helix bundle protein
MKDHRDLPAFQSAHDLLLAIHEATHRLPTTGEPGGLAVRLRAAALSTAGAIVRGYGLPGRRFAGELEHAAGRLRELGYYIDVAQRLGYLDLESALDLLEKQARARLDVTILLEALPGEELAGHLSLGSARGARAPLPVPV